MASQPLSVAATNNNTKNKPADKALVPPDEQFWQRYSPHHEAPLSGVGSFALHFVIAGFLLLAGYLGWLGLGEHRTAIPTDAVSMNQPGGGGDRHGSGDGPGDGSLAKEVAEANSEQTQTPPDNPPPERPKLKEPAVVPQNLLPEAAENDDIQRLVKAGNENVQALAGLNQDIRSKLRDGLRPAGEGKGGKGSGGGRGDGTGLGEGPGEGIGSKTMTVREKRMLRWEMRFDIRDGRDYLRQLDALGATLAIPKDKAAGEYWVIRDLMTRPVKLLDEDVAKIGQIYWNNVSPQHVLPVIRALGLKDGPSNFIAFMPPALEEKLLQEELSYRGLKEEEIFSTLFEIRLVGGKYTPVAVDQQKR